LFGRSGAFNRKCMHVHIPDVYFLNDMTFHPYTSLHTLYPYSATKQMYVIILLDSILIIFENAIKFIHLKIKF